MKKCLHKNKYFEKMKISDPDQDRSFMAKRFIWFGKEERHFPKYIITKSVIITYCCDCGKELKQVDLGGK